jgi:hypothetical protein
MGLLTTDIRKERRLSIKDVKLPAPEIKPIKVEAPSTAEERMYSKIVEKYPLFLEAVELLDLVSPVTGTRVKIVDTKPSRETLIALAKRLIKGEAIHSKEEIIEAIKTGSKVSQERAEKGFSLMLEAGAFEPIGDSYYLTGSTPF